MVALSDVHSVKPMVVSRVDLMEALMAVHLVALMVALMVVLLAANLDV